MTDHNFKRIETIVLAELGKLNPYLTYHSVQHTIDVLEQAQRIAKAEGIDDPHQILLLKYAALFHDTGFLYIYANHEEKGCDLFLEMTKDLKLAKADNDTVIGLIMSTKIPQQPENLLQQVICDADLDYLGRDDFFTIGNELRKEFLHYKIVANDEQWEQLQLKFLNGHHYHTKSSQLLREPVKQAHLVKLMQ